MVNAILRRLAGPLAVLVATVLLPPLAAAEAAPSVGWLEAALEPVASPPYEQEMVLLRLKGFYTLPVTLETMEQPSLEGFGWMQLGRDRWFQTTVGGRQYRGYERVMALFPQRHGELEIGAFRHRLTVVGPDGTRFEQPVTSPPLTLQVAPKPLTAGWWLPARSLRVDDRWDRDPAGLQPGETATRTVTLEAEGIGPELLPPMPELRSPGVLAFAGPEERSSRVTPQGPVSIVTWHWSVRSMANVPVVLEAVTIPWFDTAARQPREAVLAARRIAPAIAAAGGAERPGSAGSLLAAHAPLLGAVAGAFCGIALLFSGVRLRRREDIARLLRRLRPDPERTALRRAVRAGDAAAARTAAARLVLRLPPEDGRRPHVHEQMAGLDRHLFGREGTSAPVDLPTLRRTLTARRRRAGSA